MSTENDEDIKKLLDTNRRIGIVVRALGILLAVMFVLLVGMEIQIQRSNSAIDNVQDTVNELKAFVDELKEREANDNVVTDEGIALGLARINEILGLLCEQFPDSIVCAGG